MRKIILAFLFMLVSAIGAFAQSTTVSGTVTDAGSQAWVNGKYSFTFQPNPQFPTGPYTWSGGTLNNVISGTLDSSGAYSVSIPSSSAITPAGSTWILQVTPDATSLSFSTARTTITGGTQTLNATPPTILISWSLPPGPAISAYTDAEIGGSLPKGAEYFNTTSNLTRVWNGSAWANQGAGSGGGACPAGASGQIQFTNGTNCVGDAGLTYTVGTQSFVTGGLNADSAIFSGNLGSAPNVLEVSSNGVSLTAGPSGTDAILVSGNGIVATADSSGATFTASADSNVIFQSNNGVVSFQNGSDSPTIPGSVVQRVVAVGTDTILSTDRNNRVAYNNTTAVAVSLPTAGGTGFKNGFNVRLSNQNTGTVTITPATGTINGNATLVLLEGQFCFLSPSSAGTSYAADCGESQMTAGTGISFTRAVHGLTIAATGLQGITFPQTVAGTVNSGGIPYFNSTTQMSSSAAGTVNTLMKWGGAGNPPVASACTDNGTTVNCGSEGITTTGGMTSAGFTATSTGASNLLLVNSNGATVSVCQVPGPVSFRGQYWTGATSATNTSTITPSCVAGTNGAETLTLANAVGSTGPFTVATLGTASANLYATTTNCANGATPAVCGAAAAGAVAIPTGTNPTLTINTTSVTANSRILLTPDESLTISATTCNTTLSTLVQPVVTARTAGTSFTIQIGAIIATNPACVSYLVIN